LVSVERIDTANSFMTLLRFIDGNTTQEIQVFVWDADSIVSTLQGLTTQDMELLYGKEGTEQVIVW